ncbi:MAG: hypothetical protein COA44_07735 [Arcobacter sp.]|nr:MAG: hypothetical protein COA44_07735 [Arcobacter sp.]
MSYFKKDKKMFLNFIETAKKHKKIGHLYDKKRRNKNLNKKVQKEYLDGLRVLKKQLQSIYKIVQASLTKIIKTNYVKTYYRLKRTHIDILHLDPRSVSAMKGFEKKLNKRKRITTQNKLAKTRADKQAYYNFLRSSKNLSGNWKGKSNTGESMTASMHGNILYLNYSSKKIITVFKGKYKISHNNLNFYIEHRKRTKADISHIKKVHFSRIYSIKKITENSLTIQYKDEIIRLQKQKD